MKTKYKIIGSLAFLLSISVPANAQYTIPTVSSPLYDDEIRYVMFGTMSNTTSCGVTAPGPGSINGGYSNFTGSLGLPNLVGSVAVPTCVVGSSYSLAVGLTMCNGFPYNGVFGVFIDYNQNASFTDSGELVWTSSYVPGAASPAFNTYTAPNVTIPTYALCGLTRLRVWESETTAMTGPNGAITWGEVEDYVIYITGPATNLTVTPSTATVCPGGTVALTATGATSYTWSGGISNGVPFMPTASGIYTVSAGSGTCAATRTAEIIYSPPLNISVPNSIICANNSATLTGSGSNTYSWSTGATSQNIVVTPSVTTSYTVSGLSNSGCNTQGVTTVSVITGPPSLTVNTSNGTNGTCSNTPVSLNASGATTYSWSGGVTNGVPFTLTTAAIYSVTGTNACGTATAAISVSIHPLPNVTTSVNNPTICSGGSVILSGNGAASYVWTPSAPNNVAFSPQVTTNYTVRGTSALGCTATAVQGVTVLITPTIAPVATPTAICAGATATLTSGGATGFTWTPGTALNTPTITVSPPISTTYTLFRTNGPCASTSTLNLVVNPLPLLAVTVSQNSICAGTGVNIVIQGPITNTTYPGGFTASNLNLFPNTNTTYTVIASNAFCSNSATVPVSVNPSPTISISSSTTTICQGQSVTLNIGGAGPFTHTWLPSGNSNNPTEIVSPIATSNITVTATNSLGCTTMQQQLVVVRPLPNMALTSSQPFICAGQSAILSITNPSSNVTYSWNTGATGTSIQESPTITTIYYAIGTNTQTGCQNNNIITLSVYISTFVVSSPTAICKGSSATLLATGSPTSYFWQNVNNGVSGSSVTVSPSANIVYTVTGINGACNNVVTVPIIVNPLPNVIAAVTKSTICRFEMSTIAASGAISYSWNTGASTPTISFTLSLTTTYTVTGTDLNGCNKTVTVTQYVATCKGIEELAAGEALINIYPNPNNGNFTISSESVIKLSIVNALGQVINMISLNEENKKQVTVSSLPEGVYFITGELTGLRGNKKLVIEK